MFTLGAVALSTAPLFYKSDFMETKLKLTSPIPPSVNHYLGYRAIIKNGKAIGMSYCTNEAKKYKEEFAQYVASEVKRQNWTLEPNAYQHFYIDAIFYFPSTDRDCNNCWKCLLDALTDTQLIWLDDNVTCERVQAIYYDSVNPRVELEIYPVDYVGVFKNKDELGLFESNCESCKRFARNCSLLRKAKEGRIQSEINNGICSKYSKKGV